MHFKCAILLLPIDYNCSVKENAINILFENNKYINIDLNNDCLDNIEKSDIDHIVIDLNKSKLFYSEVKLYSNKILSILDSEMMSNKKIIFTSTTNTTEINYLDPMFYYAKLCDLFCYMRGINQLYIVHRS